MPETGGGKPAKPAGRGETGTTGGALNQPNVGLIESECGKTARIHAAGLKE